MATATIPMPTATKAAPWIEIFRAGDYRSQGKGLITRGDLERVVRNYDPSFHEAPVTVGHPKDNLPAYGWVDRLAVSGDLLLAKEKQVDPQFDELRQAGRYKKRSASFYTDSNGNVNGLRHVAYLGAQPPAVKGLQDVKFDDKGQEFIEVSFGEESQVEKTVADQIKEYFAGLFGAGTPKTFSEDDAKRIASEAAATAVAPFQAKVTELETKLTKQTADFAEREQRQTLSELGQRTQNAVVGLKASGKWIPAFDKAGVPLMFSELAKVTTTVEFGEGDAKKAVAPFDLFKDFLESLPAIVPTGRMFTGAPARVAGKGTSGDTLTDMARARQKEKNISFGEALDQIAIEQPELTQPGVAAASQV